MVRFLKRFARSVLTAAVRDKRQAFDGNVCRHQPMGILSTKNGKAGEDRHFGADRLTINRQTYANTAAKFWSALIDETQEAYPEAVALLLDAVDEGPLEAKQLSPRHVLGNVPGDLAQTDIATALQQALDEIDMFGAPRPVHVRVLSSAEELVSTVLAPESIDCEILPLVLVWLLEWAEVPPFLWNNRHIKGTFDAEDPDSGRHYHFGFELDNEDISEGLLSRRLDLRFRVSGGVGN